MSIRKRMRKPPTRTRVRDPYAPGKLADTGPVPAKWPQGSTVFREGGVSGLRDSDGVPENTPGFKGRVVRLEPGTYATWLWVGRRKKYLYRGTSSHYYKALDRL